MTDEPDPIAYTALQPGTPVQSSDGHQFGTVEAVLQVEEVDVFDGIVVGTDQGTRFVDADRVGSIFTSHVMTTLSPDEAANLPQPDQSPVYDLHADHDTGNSLTDRIGRAFGRNRGKRES